MTTGRIAFVVGHKNWGKSSTLRALTGGIHQVRTTAIEDVEFFIRRMSNDDLSDEYWDFVKSLDPATRESVIAALCPDFTEQSAARTAKLLDTLKARGYKLFFWVIKRKYGATSEISELEIARLAHWGVVEVHGGAAVAEPRARAFKKFVSTVVLS